MPGSLSAQCCFTQCKEKVRQKKGLSGGSVPALPTHLCSYLLWCLEMCHSPRTLLLNEERGISVSFYNHCSTDLGCSLPISAQTGCIFRPEEKRIWPKMLKGYFKECFSLSPFSLSLHLFVLELIPGKKKCN